MKKASSIILAICLLLALVPFGLFNVTVSAATRNEAVAWLNSLVGSKVGSGQCVALITEYYEYLGVPAQYTSNGCDYATNALPSGWTRIKGGTPQTGDILVWTGGWSNCGHVAICGNSNTFYHQNWHGEYVEVLTNSYTGGFTILSTGEFAGYWGVIRPNFSDVSVPSTSYENITPGTYAVKNNHTGTYMCVSYGADNNLQNVDMYSEVNSASRMVITKASTGYKIRPECCASRLVNPYGYTVTSGLNVNIYNDENDSTQWWQFQKVSGGYVIRNVQNPDCVLDTDGGNVFVSSYTGASTQIWSLISTHVHSYGSWKTRKAATCSSNGTEYRTCSCGAEETRTISALGHNYTGVITKPTCTSGGYTTYTCSRCSHSYTGNSTSAKGHSYSSWKVRKAATCTAKGTEYRTCSCGAEETRSTAALGHSYTSVITKPTCTSGGCTTHTCSRCKYSYTDSKTNALEHAVGKWVVVKEAEVGVEGLKEKRCTVCNKLLDRKTISALPEPESDFVKGDVNGNGVVDAKDYALAKRHCLKTYTLSEEMLMRADLNGNGRLESSEYALIKRHVLGSYVIK